MSIEIKQILQKLNTNPQKKLGQNFLINKNKIKKLISEINKVHYDSIIEIGPGLGAITEELIKNNNIICIEKDIKLFSYLKDKYKESQNFSIINEDVLKCDLSSLGSGKKLFFGNLPYNIGTKIIENFTDSFFSDINATGIFMLQKEVGQKILSDKGSKLYNGFVVKIQTFYNVKNVISLNESDFWPQPNIKSILIKLENKNRKLLSNLSYKEYTKFLFNCFKVRRKKLSNNLQMYFTKEAINDNLNNLELKQDIRAQDIDDDTFLKLFKNLTDSKS